MEKGEENGEKNGKSLYNNKSRYVMSTQQLIKEGKDKVRATANIRP